MSDYTSLLQVNVEKERNACRFAITSFHKLHQNSTPISSQRMPRNEWQRRTRNRAAAAARPAYDERDLVKLVIVWLVGKLLLSIF